MYTIDHIIQLLQSYLKGEIDPKSDKELKALFEKYPELYSLMDKLDDPEHLRQELAAYEILLETDTTDRQQRILDNILTKIELKEVQGHSRMRKLYGWAVAAACLIGLVGLGLWRIATEEAVNKIDSVKLAENLHPGSNKATLQVDNGTRIGLAQHQVGIVMGANTITYADGSLALSAAGGKQHMMTLSTPRGGQYQIVLSDGTKVWLNADTRLRYPTKFTTQQRLVELEGEAYFEVAKAAGKPFVVLTTKEKIEVLGTHFNVYSFRQEKESKVSLLEGRVKVSVPAGSTKLLEPGEQARVQGDRLAVQEVPVDESIAWTNDEFMFNNEPLGTALTQLARWYDIEIKIDPSLAQIKLWGGVSRFDTFDKVLRVIKMTDDKIKVQIEGRRVRLMK